MFRNDSWSEDPADYFSEPKIPQSHISKNRTTSNINPFAGIGNQEFNPKIGAKSKPRPSFFPKLCQNTFDKYKKEDLFMKKGEQDYNKLFQGHKDKKRNDEILNAMDSKRNVLINPQINIYICDSKYSKDDPQLNKNIQCIIKTEIKKIKDMSPSLIEGKVKKEIGESFQSDIAPAPIMAQVKDVIKGMKKLSLSDEKEKEKNTRNHALMDKTNIINKEKRFVNEGNCTLGEYYVE